MSAKVCKASSRVRFPPSPPARVSARSREAARNRRELVRRHAGSSRKAERGNVETSGLLARFRPVQTACRDIARAVARSTTIRPSDLRRDSAAVRGERSAQGAGIELWHSVEASSRIGSLDRGATSCRVSRSGRCGRDGWLHGSRNGFSFRRSRPHDAGRMACAQQRRRIWIGRRSR